MIFLIQEKQDHSRKGRVEYPEFRCEVQDPVNQQEVQERCADVRKLRNIAAASLYSHQDCCGKG